LALLVGPASGPLAGAEAERWTLSVTLRQTLSDNVFLTPERSREAITGGTLSLSYGRIKGGSSFSAGGWLGGQHFYRFGTYDRAQFGLNTSARIALAPRARLRLGAGYTNGLNVESLRSSRLGLPQVTVQSGSASVGLDYTLGAGTSADLGLDGAGIVYRAKLLVDSSQLPGDTFVPADAVAAGPPPGINMGPPSAPDETLQVLGLLTAEGLQTLNLDFATWRASLGLAHEFSPRTRISVGGDYRRTYEKPRTFSEGEQVGGQVALRQVLDSSANVALAYGYQENRFGIRLRTHSFTAQVEKAIGKKVRLDATLGSSYLQGPERASSSWTAVGGGGLSAQFRRSWLALRYTRSRYQGLIVGRSQIADLAYANLTHAVGRRVSIAGYGYYRDARDPLDPRFSFRTTLGGASLGVGIKQRTSAGVSYSYLRYDPRSSPAVQRSVLSMFLSYARQMK